MSDDKDLPSFGNEVESPRLRQKLEAMREAMQRLMGLRGDDDRSAVRWADVRAGKVGGSGQVTNITQVIAGGGESPTYTPDLTKPPTPTGLSVTVTPASLIIEFDPPIYTQGHGHKQTNIYATKQEASDTTPLSFSSAVRVFSAMGPLTVIALPSEPATRWRIWIKFESNDGVESDYSGGANGALRVVPALGDSIEEGGIDDSKVANLSAAKLTVGDGTVGGNLKSTNYSPLLSLGWIVRPDGYAEFNDVVARGTVYASAGAIGGALIQSDHIRSTNWESLVAGWRLNNNGSGQIGGIQILSDRIQSGNFESGDTGFMLRADGLFELNAPNGWVRSQMIEDKAVTSMKIDDAAVGTLQIAGNAVILPMFSQFGFGTNFFYSTLNGVSIEMRWDDGQLLTPSEMNAISSIPWRWYRPYTSNPQLVSTSGSVYRMLLCSTPEFETFGQKVSIGYSVDIGHSESSPTSWYAADIVRCEEGVSPLAQRFEKVIVTFPRGGPDTEYIDEYTGEYFPNVIVSYAPLNKAPMTNGYRTATPQTIMVQDTPPEGKYSYHLLLRSATGASLTYQSIQTAGIYGTSFAGNTWLDVKGIRR